jgi:hypothetical protein
MESDEMQFWAAEMHNLALVGSRAAHTAVG